MRMKKTRMKIVRVIMRKKRTKMLTWPIILTRRIITTKIRLEMLFKSTSHLNRSQRNWKLNSGWYNHHISALEILISTLRICQFCILESLLRMSDIKYIYFDLRVKGEPARLLLAHGGVKYTDERIELGWNDPKPWTELKPTMPWGQLPMLQWNGESICQSMAICRSRISYMRSVLGCWQCVTHCSIRFLAREFGIAGKTNMEMAQVLLSLNFIWP